MFEKEKFDVILMDVQMPIMDGLQATARIRHIELERVRKLHAEGRSASEEADVASLSPRRHRRVPIIALTASATSDYQTQCLKKGMDRFLTKPLKKETLRRILEEVIGEGQEDTRPAHPQDLEPGNRRPSSRLPCVGDPEPSTPPLFINPDDLPFLLRSTELELMDKRLDMMVSMDA